MTNVVIFIQVPSSFSSFIMATVFCCAFGGFKPLIRDEGKRTLEYVEYKLITDYTGLMLLKFNAGKVPL